MTVPNWKVLVRSQPLIEWENNLPNDKQLYVFKGINLLESTPLV